MHYASFGMFKPEASDRDGRPLPSLVPGAAGCFGPLVRSGSDCGLPAWRSCLQRQRHARFVIADLAALDRNSAFELAVGDFDAARLKSFDLTPADLLAQPESAPRTAQMAMARAMIVSRSSGPKHCPSGLSPQLSNKACSSVSCWQPCQTGEEQLKRSRRLPLATVRPMIEIVVSTRRPFCRGRAATCLRNRHIRARLRHVRDANPQAGIVVLYLLLRGDWLRR